MHVPQTTVILRHEGTVLAEVSLSPGEYVIGREAGVEIHAETPLLSRRHARLTINYDQILLEDLGSSHGTFVAEKPIADATRLFPNQPIRLGDLSLEIHRQRPHTEPGVSLAPAQATLERILPPELLGGKRYAVGEQIARGGMGAVLNARDQPTKRTVAMKVMLDTAGDGDVLRFVEEAQITAQLDHPNIVPIYELSVDELGQPFYTMKLVRGITLKKVLELLAQGVEGTVRKYPLPALLTIFQKVCDAVAFAHAKGVIHRDLKPENIMLGDYGSVLLMDWGLAKILGQKATPGGATGFTSGSATASQSFVASDRVASGEFGGTMAGSIMGTPQYMSPEQARGEVETLDGRSDVFALGAILFEMLHLRPFVSGESALEIVDKIAHEDFDWTPPKKPAPDSLVAVCRQALAFDRERRYPSVEALQRDITAYQAGFATSAEKAGAWKQIALLIKRHRTATAGLAAVLVVGLTLGTKAILEGRRAEREGARAVAALEALRRQAPGLRQLAETEAGWQRFDSALDKLDASIELEPAFLPSYWRRASLLIGLEQWADAAAALRLAHEKEPAQAQRMKILPLIDRFAAAKTDAERWTAGAAGELFAYLRASGGFAEIGRLSKKLQLGKDDQLALVRQRLEDWLGKKSSGYVRYDEVGRIRVGLYPLGQGLDTVEPLRGLPIENLAMASTRVASLEPLRGMPLESLDIQSTLVTDLSPLAGMPLVYLSASTAAHVTDLAPLKGCPLQTLYLQGARVSDLRVLQGMPLHTLDLRDTEVSDLTPLQGAPLEVLSVMNCRAIKDLTPLAGMPLKEFNCSATNIADLIPLRNAPLQILQVTGPLSDLSPLRGKPLTTLIITSPNVVDLDPLRGLPLVELSVSGCTNLRDFKPILALSKLEKLTVPKAGRALEVLQNHPTIRFIGYGGASVSAPPAEFWAKYDTEQKASGP